MRKITETVCQKCGTSERYVDASGVDKGCVKCRLAASTKFRTEQRDRKNQQNASWRKKWKDAAFTLYGNKCKSCGFDDIRALQIDHVNNDGNIERRGYGSNNQTTMFKQIVEGARDKARYQILCANCNWIKRVEENNND